MAATKPKTRNKTDNKFKEFIRSGKDFVGSEVPCFWAVLRKGILLQELKEMGDDIDRRQYPVKQIAIDLAPLVLDQWRKSNHKFTPPVVRRRLKCFGREWDYLSGVGQTSQ